MAGSCVNFYFHSINYIEPDKRTINKKELEDAGYNTSRIEALLGQNINEMSIDSLTQKVESAQSGPLKEIKCLITGINDNLNAILKTLGINPDELDPQACLIASRIVGGSKKLIVIYGDNHVAFKAEKEIILGISSFIEKGNMTMLGMERLSGECKYNNCTIDKEDLSHIEKDFKRWLNQGNPYMAADIVECMYGSRVYTFGAENDSLLKLGRAYASIGMADNVPERTQKVAENMIKEMDKRQSKVAGLVIGMYHLGCLKRDLDTKDVSYLMFMPPSIDDFDPADEAIFEGMIRQTTGYPETDIKKK